MTNDPTFYPTQVVEIAKLKEHPQNYKEHPDDQIEHIVASIQKHGVYRNIVIARDFTILAGHGVVKAARKMGLKTLPAIQLDIDPFHPQALKLLVGDNEIGHLGIIDDRLMSEILKQIKDEEPDGLQGTGYSPMMLANLVLVTRPEQEIRDMNEAAHWVGMPEYQPAEEALKVIVSFRNAEDRLAFAQLLGMEFTDKTKSIWWPHKDRSDNSSVRFVG